MKQNLSHLSHPRKTFLLLIGVNGSGKSTIAKMLKKSYPHALIDSEERAFDRKYLGKTDETTHASILNDAKELVKEWERYDLVVVDRWYETYFGSCKLPLSKITEIETMILSVGFKGYIINLMIGDDLSTMVQRLEYTKNQREPSWWDPMNGTIEERAKRDLMSQKKNRIVGLSSRFVYYEIDTTDMNWERIINEVEEKL